MSNAIVQVFNKISRDNVAPAKVKKATYTAGPVSLIIIFRSSRYLEKFVIIKLAIMQINKGSITNSRFKYSILANSINSDNL